MAFLSGWNQFNRIKITLDKDNFDSTESDFPNMVHISEPLGLSCVFDELGSNANRKKIAFTSADGTTELYAEIELFDYDNNEAWMHVLIPSASSSIDTTIYLYFDSNHADNTTYIGDSNDAIVHNVWNTDFKAVWHMAQDPDGDGADAIKDSTSNALDLTPNGSMTSADLVDGKVGKAIDFDGTDDDLEANGSSLNLSSDDFEFNFTINFNNLPTNGGEADQIFNLANPTPDRRSYLLDLMQSGGVLYLRFQAFNGTATPTIFVQRTVTLSTDTWYNFSIRRAGSDVHVYQNGAELSTATTIGSPTIYDNTDDSFFIGSYNGIWSLGDFIIDEFRITIGDSRSASWVKATYHSLWDSMNTFSEIPISGTINLVNNLLDFIAVSGSIDLINSLQLGSTVDLVNSLNQRINGDINIINSILQRLEGELNLVMDIEERTKVFGTLDLLNRILDSGNGVTQNNYEFSKGHGL